MGTGGALETASMSLSHNHVAEQYSKTKWPQYLLQPLRALVDQRLATGNSACNIGWTRLLVKSLE